MHENRETSEALAAQPSCRSVDEGQSHKVRMYVPEESHSGIVPMNHSNKDRASLAESEEGRLLIKENTFPSGTFPTQSGVCTCPTDGRVYGQAPRSAVIHPR